MVTIGEHTCEHFFFFWEVMLNFSSAVFFSLLTLFLSVNTAVGKVNIVCRFVSLTWGSEAM